MGKQSDSYDLERAKCYMENYLSRNVMASGLAKYCKIYLFYNSDSPELQDMEVNTFGTGVMEDSVLREILCQGNDLRTTEIIRKMKNCSRDPWELAEVLNCKYEKLKNIVGL